jgi:hypothetical protein
MPLFNFMLRPVAEIQPWGGPERPSLSWFSLSDGWYWLELAGQELFRGVAPESPGEPPYAGYQVVRLWEDVLEVVRVALAPLPEDVAARLRTPERFIADVDRMRARDCDDQVEQVRLHEGLAFWNARELASPHLVGAPELWLWRDGETMRALWRSLPAGAALWQPAAGTTGMPVDQFVAELRAFDRAFLAAMGERIADLVQRGGLPGVAIDLAHLAFEQRDRATWLDNALTRRWSEDWTPARQLLAGLG